MALNPLELLTPDRINACFQFASIFFISLNIKAVLRDRSVCGLNWKTTVFNTVWSGWSTTYYFLTGATWSAAISSASCVLSITYTLMVLYFLAGRRTPLGARA